MHLERVLLCGQREEDDYVFPLQGSLAPQDRLTMLDPSTLGTNIGIFATTAPLGSKAYLCIAEYDLGAA